MKKSGKTAAVIIIAVAVIVAVPILMFIHGVVWFLGYETPVERYYYKLKTDAALEKKSPGHDFDVREEHGWGEYGYSVGIYGMDETGYRDIRVGDFFCRTDEEDGTETKDELEESIIKEIMTKRKIEEDRKK